VQVEATGIGEGGPGGAARGRALVPLLTLGLLLLFAFRGPLAGRMFYLRDISQNHYPMRLLVTERLRAGDLPLWNPYHGGGTPLLANPNNLVLHPTSLLFLVLTPGPAFTASILLQYLLLAAGGYLLARKAGAGRDGAALAAAVLSLSGPAASLASLQNILSSAAWVPLGIWAYLRGLEPGRRWFLGIASACAGVIIMTGEPASFAAFILLGLVLGMAPPIDSNRQRRSRDVLTALGMVLILGLLLAAAQVLPARELLALSERGAGFTAAEGLKWSLHPQRILEAILPRLFGDPTRLSPQAWWGGWLFEGGYPFLMTIHLGAIPCLLAALAVACPGRNRVLHRGLGVAALLAVLLALGRHSVIYRALFETVPLMRQFRYPERFLVTALFPFAILAGLGLDRLLDRSASGRRVVVWMAGAAAAAFACSTILAASPFVADRLLAGLAAVPATLLGSETGAVLRGALLTSSLWVFAETAALAGFAALALRHPDVRLVGVPGIGILAACGLSMVLAASPALSTAAPGWITSPSPLSDLVGHGPDAPRLHHGPRPDGLSIWAKTDELAWGYRFDRFSYALASGDGDHVPTILDPATDRMDLKDQVDLGRALAELPLHDRARVLSICRAGFLLSYEPLQHEALEPTHLLDGYSRPPLHVYRLRAIQPRVRFVGQALRPSHRGDWAASLADPGYDPQHAVLLAEAPAESGKAGTAGSAAILEDRPERIRIQVRAEGAGYVVLADAYAPGWRALVDGRPAPILKADGLFRAVATGPGEHEVIMTYEPTTVGVGLTLSFAGVLFVVAWGMHQRRRRA
jgi:membrane protein YfhO